MKKLILNALAKAGIATDGLSDDQLLEAYNKLLANQGPEDEDETGGDEGGGDDNGDAIAKAVNKALKPINDQIKALNAKINAGDDEQKKNLIETIVNSKKYPGIDEQTAKLLPLETLKQMAANCGTAHGLPLNLNEDKNNAFGAPVEMPK